LTDLLCRDIYYPSHQFHGSSLLATYVRGDNTKYYKSRTDEDIKEDILDCLVEIHGKVAREQYKEGKVINWLEEDWSIKAFPWSKQGGIHMWGGILQHHFMDKVFFAGEYTSKFDHSWIQAAVESACRVSYDMFGSSSSNSSDKNSDENSDENSGESFEESTVRIPQPCRTKSGEDCIFPFNFKGKTYYKCIYTNSPTPWCATMTDQSGNVVINRWGDCDLDNGFSSCEADSQPSATCITTGGPTPNRPCVFPFKHNGRTYSMCTDVAFNKFWCSTATNLDGTHIIGQYGLCSSSCPSISN